MAARVLGKRQGSSRCARRRFRRVLIRSMSRQRRAGGVRAQQRLRCGGAGLGAESSRRSESVHSHRSRQRRAGRSQTSQSSAQRLRTGRQVGVSEVGRRRRSAHQRLRARWWRGRGRMQRRSCSLAQQQCCIEVRRRSMRSSRRVWPRLLRRGCGRHRCRSICQREHKSNLPSLCKRIWQSSICSEAALSLSLGGTGIAKTELLSSTSASCGCDALLDGHARRISSAQRPGRSRSVPLCLLVTLCATPLRSRWHGASLCNATADTICTAVPPVRSSLGSPFSGTAGSRRACLRRAAGACEITERCGCGERGAAGRRARAHRSSGRWTNAARSWQCTTPDKRTTLCASTRTFALPATCPPCPTVPSCVTAARPLASRRSTQRQNARARCVRIADQLVLFVSLQSPFPSSSLFPLSTLSCTSLSRAASRCV